MELKNNHYILMIGDGSDLTASLTTQLQSHGYPRVVAASGDVGTQVLNEEPPDIVMIVYSLPHENVTAQCRSIRANSAVPIVVVVGRGVEQHCIDSLESGADEYVAKPFTPRELAARVEAAIRRSHMQPYRSGLGRAYGQSEGVLHVDNVRLELTTCRVSVNGVVKTLTPNEFRLMAVFMRGPGEVFTREDLRQRVWPDDQHSLHLVEVHIANLRAKIEADPHHPNYIVTVRSRGYKFVTPES